MNDTMLWHPPADSTASSMGRFVTWLQQVHGRSFANYDELWQWSCDDLDGFWLAVWEFFALTAPGQSAPISGRVLVDDAMPGARWFPDVQLNYAEKALRGDDDAVAVVSASQTRDDIEMTFRELRDEVARVRHGLQQLGVSRGDRVAAYLPNIAETLVAFLATASIGAVWSSCAPEFGTNSVVSRFEQIEPKVLLVVDGYRYGTKAISRHDEIAQLQAALPTLAATVVVPYLDAGIQLPGTTLWSELRATPSPLTFEMLAFDHPLYVLYSSGTTGLPKPIVHSHGGIVVEHVKALGLHHDLDDSDRLLWFTTTGWMMWNYSISILLLAGTVVCFDGDPGAPNIDNLFAVAAEHAVTSLGTSPAYVGAVRKAGVVPKDRHDLDALRSLAASGAPLSVDASRWLIEAVRPGAMLVVISGGTDVCSAFVGPSPLLAIHAGEMACRYLGARVESWSSEGRSLENEQGELVITRPLPSMPVGFWNDADGDRYRRSYFAMFPGVWHHGDWITISSDGSCVISGRSDATLNRGGVRHGTAEVYSVVEAIAEIHDSLIVHLEDADGGAGTLVLFVQLRPGDHLSDDVRSRIARALRSDLSPRYVPDIVHEVRVIPRTLSGKKLEVPVKRILLGREISDAASIDALVDPTSLDAFVEFRDHLAR